MAENIVVFGNIPNELEEELFIGKLERYGSVTAVEGFPKEGAADRSARVVFANGAEANLCAKSLNGQSFPSHPESVLSVKPSLDRRSRSRAASKPTQRSKSRAKTEEAGEAAKEEPRSKSRAKTEETGEHIKTNNRRSKSRAKDAKDAKANEDKEAKAEEGRDANGPVVEAQHKADDVNAVEARKKAANLDRSLDDVITEARKKPYIEDAKNQSSTKGKSYWGDNYDAKGRKGSWYDAPPYGGESYDFQGKKGRKGSWHDAPYSSGGGKYGGGKYGYGG